MSARRPWHREPLIHFAVLGLALFGLFALVGPGDEDGEAIVLTERTRARIEAQQTRRLGREPTAEELEVAIRRWADNEMLYREARALGLDRGDPIVRRRLIQKMKFLLEEERAQAEPTDAELEAWIAEHSERFEQAPRRAFTHVFVKSSARVTPEQTLADYERALADGADPASMGEAFVLGQDIGPKTAADLNRSFGQKFGDALFELEDDGKWHRLRSLYGWHLVHIDETLPGRLAGVDEVRSQAREGLRREARERAREQAVDELRSRYELVEEDR